MATGYLSTNNLAAKMNLAPPPASTPLPPALTEAGYRSPFAAARNGLAALAAYQRPPATGGGLGGYTAGGIGANAGPPQGMSSAPAGLVPATLQSVLTPGLRTLIKLGTAGAAVYFLAKGEMVVGGAVGAAAVGAWVLL